MNRFIIRPVYLVLSISLLAAMAFMHARVPTDANPAQPFPIQMPVGGIPGLPKMSDTDMKQLEAELAELNSMLEGLSPEDQARVLDNMVQEAMAEVEEGLSDEDKKLLRKLETGDITDAEFEKLLNVLTPTKEEEAPTAEPTPAPKAEPKFVITSQHQLALDRINSLINHTNLFIQKAATIPELPGTISKWEREQKIDWRKNNTWNSFRADLDTFVSKLEKLKEQNPKTERYIHLDELLANQTLYNNLGKVEKTVAEFEPLLEELAPIGGIKVPEGSKKALQKLLSQYNETLYILQLNQALDALFTKFEPTAKKMREEEEKARKKAAEEQKKVRRPGRSITAGTAPEYAPPFEDYHYDDSDPFFYDNPPQEVFIPTYEPPKQDSFLPTSRVVKQPEPAKTPALAGKKTDKKDDKSGDTFKVPEESVDITKLSKKDPEDKKSQISMSPQFKKAVEKDATLIQGITQPLEEAAALIKDNKVVSQLDADLLQAQSYNKSLVDQLIPDIYNALRKAQRGLTSFQSAISNKPTDQKKTQQNQVKDKTKKAFEQIDSLVKAITTAQGQLTSFPLVKQYLYFDPQVDKLVYMSNVLTTLNINYNLYIQLWQANGHQYSNLLATNAQYVAQTQSSPAVQQALDDMAQAIDYLERVEQQIPRPIPLDQVKQTAQDLKNTISKW